jgi:sulfur carrier protein ThiS
MCCSTGICGNDIDPALIRFASLLTQLSRKGVRVERYNLGQQPMAFVQNATVKALLDSEGVAALPLILVDGEVHVKGRYLTAEEREAISQSASGENAQVSA